MLSFLISTSQLDSSWQCNKNKKALNGATYARPHVTKLYLVTVEDAVRPSGLDNEGTSEECLEH